MILVKNLLKKYKKNEVLNIDYLKIENNEKIAFMGVNGAGKTTLGEIILGTKKKTSGKIEIDILNLRKNAVFQESSFDSELPLKEIANFYCRAFKSNIDVDNLFEKFDLLDKKHIRYRKLSGGQKQKFKFLISSLNKPNLLLLDELTTSLDYIWRSKIIKIMKQQINDNDSTVILISHDIVEISEICNRVLLVENGKISKDVKLTDNVDENQRIIHLMTE